MDQERSRARRGSNERGAALVEFAIVLPVVVALLVGMITGGVSLSRKNSVTNAVREGTRLGATLPEDGSWASSVQDRVVLLSGGDLTSEQVCVQLVRKDSSSAETVRKALLGSGCSSLTPPASTGVPAGQCVVKVWARRDTVLQAVVFSQTIALNGTAIGRYERTGVPNTCAT